jgi:choline dehydrogenase-like flavoprotein
MTMIANNFDAIVIGSGAGGAPIAQRLTSAGKSVLVIEKGPLLQPQYLSANGLSDFKRDELFATGPEKRIGISGVANQGQGYFSSHVEPDLNDEPHIYQEGDGRDYATLEGYTAQVIGGGTQLYGAVHLRFTPTDLRLGSFNQGRTDLRADPNGDVRREARDWAITYEELEPYYCQVEELVGINGTSENQLKSFSKDHLQKPLTPNPISEYARKGMEAQGERYQYQGKTISPYRTPLAVITEDHPPSNRKVPTDRESIRTSYVNRYGDALGLKSSTWVSLLAPVADHPNLTIWTNCIVTLLRHNGDRISEIVFRDPGGQEQVLPVNPGAVVAVACSAIESVRLLELSAREDSAFSTRINSNDLLGRYFLTHCFGGAETPILGNPARFPPQQFDKSASLDSDWAIDYPSSEDFMREFGLWAGAAIYNNTSDQALPLSLARTHGSQDIDTIWQTFDAGFWSTANPNLPSSARSRALHGQGMIDFFRENFGTRLSVSFMANQVPLPSNRILLHPTVVDKWKRPVAWIQKDWHSHDRYLMDVLANQCREILRVGDANPNQDEIESGGIYMAGNARARIANHILGGARFGRDRNDSVLDPNCRAWDFDNLYVTDGSFMPTSGGANPTHTIEANAFRVADHLLRRL